MFILSHHLLGSHLFVCDAVVLLLILSHFISFVLIGHVLSFMRRSGGLSLRFGSWFSLAAGRMCSLLIIGCVLMQSWIRLICAAFLVSLTAYKALLMNFLVFQVIEFSMRTFLFDHIINGHFARQQILGFELGNFDEAFARPIEYDGCLSNISIESIIVFSQKK